MRTKAQHVTDGQQDEHRRRRANGCGDTTPPPRTMDARCVMASMASSSVKAHECVQSSCGNVTSRFLRYALAASLTRLKRWQHAAMVYLEHAAARWASHAVSTVMGVRVCA